MPRAARVKPYGDTGGADLASRFHFLPEGAGAREGRQGARETTIRLVGMGVRGEAWLALHMDFDLHWLRETA